MSKRRNEQVASPTAGLYCAIFVLLLSVFHQRLVWSGVPVAPDLRSPVPPFLQYALPSSSSVSAVLCCPFSPDGIPASFFSRLLLLSFTSGGEEDGGGDIPYVEMIRTALLKLPGRQGNLPTVCAYIEVCSIACCLLLYPTESSCPFPLLALLQPSLRFGASPGTGDVTLRSDRLKLTLSALTIVRLAFLF